MKHVHTIINNAITNRFIKFINSNFNPADHSFYVIRGWSKDLNVIEKSSNVYIINNFRNLFNGFRLLYDLNVSKQIFIHGLFTPYLVGLLFFQPWLLKKCNWIIWGGDLQVYKLKRTSIRARFIEFMRGFVIKKFSYIVTSIKGDYELVREWYSVEGLRRNATYPLPIELEQIDEIISSRCFNPIDTDNQSDQVRIIIGNSSNEENKIPEIIGLLKKFHDRNIKIYANLSYGEEEYSKFICEMGTKEFQEKFVGVTKFMPISEYILFLNSMDIMIFNHERQQGLGNLLIALYLGKKIYINPKSPLWNLFKTDLNINVGNTLSIKSESFNEFIFKDPLKDRSNKLIVEKILSNNNLVFQWKELFS